MVIERESVEVLVRVGYAVQKDQIVGGPDWMKTALFDVDGVPDVPGEPDLKQFQSLVRKLLEQRFGLKAHTVQRSMEVYALTLAKGGPKMQKSADEVLGGTGLSASNSERRTLRGQHTTIPEFLGVLQSAVLDRPVVDRSGLTGRWDFTLQWRPNDMADTGDPNALPGLFTAIQEQLGLKLEPMKTPADVLSIDNVERPSAN